MFLAEIDVAALARRLPSNPLTRFAPAPTGWLHLGHALNALYVWRVTEALGGRVLLRIEDHDRTRCRPEYERGILEDLEWLGFRADAQAPRQSEREAAYRNAVGVLHAKGLVYACDCSRREIAAKAGDATGQSERRYSGRCRDRALPLEDGFGWRVRIDPGEEVFDDARLGWQAQEPAAQCGDVLIRDRHGNWTYQFAVTVDDWTQAIDLVIRGADLRASTGRQLRLARLLGRETPPVFLHHALVMKSPAQKLSKSDRDTGIRDLRARGWTREQVLNGAAFGSTLAF